MNPLAIDMLVKEKQTEIIHDAEKRRLYDDQSDPWQKLAFSLAVIGVIVLLVLWAIVAI